MAGAWRHACYDKLFKNLTFDNSKMFSTDFMAQHDIKTTFSSHRLTQISTD